MNANPTANMNVKSTEDASYSALLTEISSMAETVESMSRARRNQALSRLYWRIGERMAAMQVSEQGLVERLSRDMNAKFGSGYSRRNLFYMQKFYHLFDASAVQTGLSWGHFRALLQVGDDAARAALFAQAVQEELSNMEVALLARRAAGLGVPQLVRRSGALRVAEVVSDVLGLAGAGVRDLGFETRVQVKLTGVGGALAAGDLVQVAVSGTRGTRVNAAQRGYFYDGALERVVDGDTVIAVVALGCGVTRRMRVRLKGVDAAPIETASGKEADALVCKRLKPGDPVVLETFRADPYGRYLAHVFYWGSRRREKASAETILDKGRFLNQELLDAGLAVAR